MNLLLKIKNSFKKTRKRLLLRYEWLFFDMDGTLYNNRFHEVSEKTFKMLNELQSQGHFVALSTSRCQSELKNLPSCMRSFQFDCMISDGGALILDKQKRFLK